jgi:hypothetical protein
MDKIYKYVKNGQLFILVINIHLRGDTLWVAGYTIYMLVAQMKIIDKNNNDKWGRTTDTAKWFINDISVQEAYSTLTIFPGGPCI